jgi:hypothetical protein
MQLHTVGMALGLPGCSRVGHRLCGGDATIETWAGQDSHLALGPMQPTRVLGRAVAL